MAVPVAVDHGRVTTTAGRTRTGRDWGIDSLFFLSGLLFTLFTVLDGVAGQLDRATVVADAGLGVLSCLLLWWRTRWPVAVALIITVLSVYSLAASGVAMLAFFSLAVHRRFATVAPVLAGLAAASFASLAVRADLSMPDRAEVLLGIACITAVLAWGMYVRARRRLAESRQQEQELRVIQARQAERHRIAREMHDVLAHRISLLSLHAGALELRPDAPPAEIARAAGVIRDSAALILDDMRDIIGVLRTGVVGDAPEPPQPTLAALPALIEESRAAATSVTVSCQIADLTTVPAGIGRAAYRILQEGLTNARKHGAGSTVTVDVYGGPGTGLTVELRNPSPEHTSGSTGTGIGLIGLTERVSLAGGTLSHGPTPDGHFELHGWLPWPT